LEITFQSPQKKKGINTLPSQELFMLFTLIAFIMSDRILNTTTAAKPDFVCPLSLADIQSSIPFNILQGIYKTFVNNQ
jgi:hypothetical protein